MGQFDFDVVSDPQEIARRPTPPRRDPADPPSGQDRPGQPPRPTADAPPPRR